MCLIPNSNELSKSLLATALTNHWGSSLAKRDDPCTFASVLHVNCTLLNYERGSGNEILTHPLFPCFLLSTFHAKIHFTAEDIYGVDEAFVKEILIKMKDRNSINVKSGIIYCLLPSVSEH